MNDAVIIDDLYPNWQSEWEFGKIRPDDLAALVIKAIVA